MQPPFYIHKRFCTGYIIDNNDPMRSSVIPTEQDKTTNVNSSYASLSQLFLLHSASTRFTAIPKLRQSGAPIFFPMGVI